jgi:hypothetical protein
MTDSEPRADSITWKAHIRVDKFTPEQVRAAKAQLGLDDWPTIDQLNAWGTPAEYVELDDANALTQIGRRRLMDRFTSVAANQGFDATHGRIGVGDGSTAWSATDTDLSAAAGSTHRWFQLVNGAPTSGTGASSGVGTFVAVFAAADGDFVWNEWGIDGGTASGNTVTTEGNTTPGLINRKVVSLGTKVSPAVWTFTCTITLT